MTHSPEPTNATTESDADLSSELVQDDLVEDVSIDGMCGVY